MLPIQLKEEITDPSLESFLFFFQVMDEQLYDFTDHSFKAPALNTFTRTLELQALALSNHQAGIGKDALIPFVEELEWSITEDAALSTLQRALCKTHMQAVRDSLSEADRIARSLAGLRISLGDYFSNIQEEIKNCVLNAPTRKDDLSKLASAFIVQAEAFGYPRRHTYHTVQIVIRSRLRGRKSIDCKAILDEFFGRFSSKSEYHCVLIVSDSVRNFPELQKRFGIEYIGDKFQPDGLTERQAKFLAHREASQAFIRFKSVKSQSAVRAHDICAAKFAAFVSIVRYVEHRLDIRRSKLALIERVADGKRFIVRDDLDPMHCWNPSHNAGEAEMLRLYEATHQNHLLDESRSRLQRAIRYHDAALQTESPENQLVDLWAALEGLLSVPRKDVSKITFFAESILPSITLSYPEKLLRSLYPAVSKNPKLMEIIRKEVGSSSSEFGQFVHFMLCKEYAGQRAAAAALIKGKDPLLLNRCWQISKRLSTRKAILETITLHRKKVKWHIERIYSMRNSIMHSAKALPHLPTLVENLHVYIDSLINSISAVAISAEERISIESALQYLASWERYRLASLSDRSPLFEAELDLSTVWESAFGRDLAITPSP